MSTLDSEAQDWKALRLGLALVSAVVVVALVAWPIHEAVRERVPRLERMLRCFQVEKGMRTESVGNDLIAASAKDGSLVVTVEGSGAHIALARTEDEAAAIRRAYLRVDPALAPRIDVRGRVVYLWDGPPT